ncbi:MAG: CoA transferase [Subtercola sp.]|nr:CoA transferase [Subtercola sp.]
MSDSTAPDEAQPMPLAGIRVLDLSRVVSGPFGSLLLADLGAEVIRVESIPGARQPVETVASPLTEEEAFAWGLHRNKHSIAIDLKSAAGREIIYKLVGEADIVYDNFRPGVMERLGLSHDALLAQNPSIITCSLSGFGGDGPWARMPAYDPIVQAMSGTMSFTKLSLDGVPVRWGIPIGDLFAGIIAAIGIVAATIHRDKTGVGQHIDVSMLDVMLALNTYRVPQALTFENEPVPSPFEGGQGTVPFGNFECSDGWVALCISQRMWKTACTIMQRPDLIVDERFSTNLARNTNRDELIAILQGVFKTRTADDWQAEMMSSGVVVGKVTGVGDVFNHPQVLGRGMAVKISDKAGRTATVAGDSLKFSDVDTWWAPREAGADSALVLGSLLRLSTDELNQLDEARVIHLGDPTGGAPLIERTPHVVQPAKDAAPTDRPLKGSIVLELNGDEPSKCFAGQLLADLGARVIRVDRPAGQNVEPYPDEAREAAFRAALNRGKQSVTADLKQPEGAAFFKDLVARADVVLDNYRPGVLTRLGIDGASLREVNPRVISTSITGFGHTGPWSSYPAFDNAIQALGGGMSITVDPSQPEIPIRWGNPIGGLTGAMFAALGTVAALRRRESTGVGEQLDISLLDSQVALLSYRVPQAVTVGRLFLPEPRRGGSGSLPFGAFRCGDGRYFVICITPQFWHRFCETAGHPEWAEDPRFVTEPLRRANEQELYDVVEPSFLARTADDWQSEYFEANLPGAVVLTTSEAFSQPQALARGMRITIPDDEITGGIEVANSPLKFSVSAPVPPLGAPIPGRDTAAVAAEFGLTAPLVEVDSPAARWGRLPA